MGGGRSAAQKESDVKMGIISAFPRVSLMAQIIFVSPSGQGLCVRAILKAHLLSLH